MGYGKGHMDGSARRPRVIFTAECLFAVTIPGCEVGGLWVILSEIPLSPQYRFQYPRQACSFSNPGNPDISCGTCGTPTSTTTNIEPHPPESSLTIIVPCCNEEESLPLLFKRLDQLIANDDRGITYTNTIYSVHRRRLP